MRRTPLLVAAATLALGGVAYAASRPTAAPVGLLAVGGSDATTTSTALEHHEPAATSTTTSTIEQPAQHEVTTSTTEHHGTEPSTTTTTTEHHEPTSTTTTTVGHHEATTTSTTEHPPTTTTSTTVRPGTGPIHLECTTPHTDDLRVTCDWGPVPEHTAYIVVMREKTGPSQPIDRIDDPSVHDYVDDTAESGVTYSYRVSAFAEDGSFLGTSNPVKVTPGPEPGSA